uniref:Uncharacterized protein n=1 Tax=Physcomitrium patens TaxID=3218 RepID=A0A2K1IZY3_PHYPA|nr:hypothetical protein PHYPA_022740 [Physcomitrium patens]
MHRSLKAIGRGCKKLKNHIEIRNDALIIISKKCNKLGLQNESRCHRVDNVGLINVAQRCPFLMHLDVSLDQLVSNYQTIVSCPIVYCPCLISTGMATISIGCNSLKKILIEK